ncbi:unnamed protein product, partial [Discosporangium mesarthrocarpum]
ILSQLLHFAFDSPLQRMLLAPIFLFWAVTEPLRFYFGFKGNIKEMVPHMSAFLLITLFPQFFSIAFFSFYQEHVFPADTVIGSLSMVFLVLELLFGYHGIKSITSKRTAQFLRVAQEEFLSR